MTSMTTICSLILALMIALSGGADVPVTPETMNVLTLRNFEIEADILGDEINAQLPMEFQLSSAVSASDAALNFQIYTEDGVRMPLHGRVVSDALQFAIGDSDKAYALTEGMLREELDLDSESQSTIDAIGDMLVSLLESELMSGEVDIYRSTAGIMRVMADEKGAIAEDTTLEYAGETYPAVKRSFTLDQDEIKDMIDNPPAGLSADDLIIVQGYAAVLDYYNNLGEFTQTMSSGLADEVQVTLSFSDNVRVEIVEAEIGGETYLRARQKFSDSETEYDIEYIVHGDHAEMRQVNIQEFEHEGGDTSRSSTDMEYIIEGPAAAPEALSMSMSTSSYVALTENFTYGTSQTISMTGGVTDGLWDISGEMKNLAASSLDDAAGNNMEIRIPFSYAEVLEEDGSKTAHFEMSIIEEDMVGIRLAFDLNYAEVPYADAFEGREMLYLDEMNEAEFAALEAEWQTAVEAAGAVFEAWVESVQAQVGGVIADGSMAYAIGDGEDSMASTVTVSSHDSIRESVRDNVLGGEVSYAEDEYDDWDYDYEDEYVVPTYSTWEEAQAVFCTELPKFTAPEAYPLEKIEVFEDFLLYAYFGGEDGFTMDISYAGDEGMAEYTLMEGGKLAPEDQIKVSCWLDGEYVYMLEFRKDDCKVSMYFAGNYTLADVEAILAGFEL